MKKFLFLTLPLIFLGGCGGSGGQSSNVAKDNPPAPVPSPPSNPQPCPTPLCGDSVLLPEDLKLTEANIGRLLFRSYQVGSKGGLVGFALSSASSDFVCSSGTYSGENIDANSDSMVSANDTRRKRFANCQTTFNGTNFKINGSLDYKINSVAGGQVTGWDVFQSGDTSSLEYGDQQGCNTTSCSYSINGKKIVIANNKTTVGDFISIRRLNWLDSPSLYLLIKKDSFYQKANNATENNQLSFAFSALAVDEMFGFRNSSETKEYSLATETLVPFRFNDSLNGGFPSEGKLKITGANQANAVLTANGLTGAVTVEFDNNGDGVFDSTRSSTWAALAAE
jgi:hypothetical protein